MTFMHKYTKVHKFFLDLRKLHTHACIDPDDTLESLQNKVQMDI